MSAHAEEERVRIALHQRGRANPQNAQVHEAARHPLARFEVQFAVLLAWAMSQSPPPAR